jgi:hypothetical protein
LPSLGAQPEIVTIIAERSKPNAINVFRARGLPLATLVEVIVCV